MKELFVGGTRDGCVLELRELSSICNIPYIRSAAADSIEQVTFTAERYRLRIIPLAEGDLYFYALDSMSDLVAFSKLLAGYKAPQPLRHAP